MWGFIILVTAIAVYVFGAVLALVQGLLGVDRFVSVQIVWFAGAPVLLGIALIGFDAILLAPKRRGGRRVFNDPIDSRKVTVALTGCNDEKSIGSAVDDFINHPQVQRVLVVDNNSSDATSERATARGAIVHREVPSRRRARSRIRN